MQVERVNYTVYINSPKSDGKKLTSADLVNVGYMAGRFGINLGGNPNESNPPSYTDKGLVVNINSCTTDLFEDNLTKSGIKFDRMA